MSSETIDRVVVNEEGEEVVELQIDEFEAMNEAISMYRKENALLDIHISQLKDMIEKLEKENELLREKVQKLENSASNKRFANKNIRIITDHIY